MNETEFFSLSNLSTRSLICSVNNLEFDIENIFKFIPINKRIKDYPFLLVFLYHKGETRGIDEYKRKKQKPSFRNAINIIILNINNNDRYNVKVTRKGTFQISGGKNQEFVHEAIKYMIELFLNEGKEYIKKTNDEPIKIDFRTIMTNYVIDLKFKVNKYRLNKVIQEANSPYSSLYEETNFGYTGINVKKNLNLENNKIRFQTFVYDNNRWLKSFQDYHPNKKKKLFNTYLVFHSGKVIVSGMVEETMEQDFLRFFNFISSNRVLIEDTSIC